ncbi:MAG: hypothetical protein R3B64_02735 [Candidatus Paceibacterota bacterium]|nr:hypothetical protein [Candidatus Nomurabacteria bacterium]
MIHIGPKIAYASSVDTLIANINRVIINPLIIFIFSLALVYFIWGVIEFISAGDNKGDKKEQGRSHMLWGIVGMFIMISVFAILRLIANSIGADDITLPS